MKLSTILGLNARAQIYSYPYNSQRAKRVADSKLLTEKVLKRVGVPTPAILKKFRNEKDIDSYNWEKLPAYFALKPSRGLGGEGIIVAKGLSKNGKGWETAKKQIVNTEDLKFHVQDILEGAYSLGNIPDVAFIQEYVGRHEIFKKIAYRGTPDIRIIVFNKVPIMAMLRLPTKESGGRANLHQGAIGVGVDIATGVTTKAIWHGQQITHKPRTNTKLSGIKIPKWEEILEIAVRAQMASGLGYAGVDIVLHPEKGPMVIELNSQPGLQIQLANMSGLKKRLERVIDLDVRDATHGVKIAQALFITKQLRVRNDKITIKAAETVRIRNSNGKKIKVVAKIDTGAYSTSIDKNLAKDLGLFRKDNILWYKNAISALGKQRRPVVNITFWLSGKRITTIATVANREGLTYKMIVGRSDLRGFLISPE